MQLDLIQELTEARLYRGRETLAGKKARDLAKVTYLSFMMLEILRHEDNSYAKRYTKDTMWYDNFESMKGSASDLHNLIAILTKQSNYSSKIETDASVSVPELQVRRYLRDIENDRKMIGLDRAFFKTLEEFLKISDGEIKSMRVYIADWLQCSAGEKRRIKLRIKNILGPSNFQLDILMHFRSLNEDFADE